MFLSVAATGVSLEIFLRGDGLRTRVEATLSRALGRTVTIRRLELSIASGSLLAEHMVIAEDAHFGSEPFIQTETVKMGIEVLPLLLRRQVRLDRFVFESPSVHLLRDPEGAWNYATVGKTGPPRETPTPGVKRALPDLAVSSVEVKDGRVVVDMDARAGGSGEPGSRRLLYEHLDLSVRDFSLVSSFPLRISLGLGNGGVVQASGKAGPFDRLDASATPASAHIEALHLDLLASGLVQPSKGVAGQLDRVTADVRWSEHAIHVSGIDVEGSELTILRGASAPGPAKKTSVWSEIRDRMSVENAHVRIGTLRIGTTGQRPAVYRLVEARVAHWRAGDWSAFSVGGQLPGEGSFTARGKTRTPAADRNGSGTERTQIDADLHLRHLNLRSSGLLSPGSGTEGVADLETHVRTEGETLLLRGSAQIAGLKLASNGQPSRKPVAARFTVRHKPGVDGGESSGTIEGANLSVGAATLNVAGTYRIAGAGPAVHLNVSGTQLPLDEIEAFLPAVGVTLPEGSRLAGGTLTASMVVQESAQERTISGPVRLEGTRLTGFDLGAKLASLSKYTGGRIGSATVAGTNVRSLAMDVRVAGGEVRTDNIAADIAGLGTATGAGTVRQGGVLDYRMLLKLSELVPGPGGAADLARGVAGQLRGAWAARALSAVNWLASGPLKNGVPILIGGTSHHPTFTPDLGALIPASKPRGQRPRQP